LKKLHWQYWVSGPCLWSGGVLSSVHQHKHKLQVHLRGTFKLPGESISRGYPPESRVFEKWWLLHRGLSGAVRCRQELRLLLSGYFNLRHYFHCAAPWRSGCDPTRELTCEFTHWMEVTAAPLWSLMTRIVAPVTGLLTATRPLLPAERITWPAGPRGVMSATGHSLRHTGRLERLRLSGPLDPAAGRLYIVPLALDHSNLLAHGSSGGCSKTWNDHKQK